MHKKDKNHSQNPFQHGCGLSNSHQQKKPQNSPSPGSQQQKNAAPKQQKSNRQQNIELAMLAGDVGFWHYFPLDNKVSIDHSWLSEKLGYDNNIFVTKDLWADIIHPSDLERIEKSFSRTIHGETDMFKEELRLLKSDDSWFWIMSKAKVSERDSSGRAVKMSGVYLDIHDRKISEEKLIHEKELQKLISEINFLIGDIGDINDILEKCLAHICEFMDWPLGHIYSYDSQVKALKSTNAWYSYHQVFKPFMEETSDTEFRLHEGLVGKVFASEEACWIPDISDYKGYKRVASAKNLVSSCIAIPVHVNGRVAAVMEFYHHEKREENPVQIRYLTLIARQIGYMFERNLIREQIHEQEKRFRYIAENSQDKISVLDSELNCIYTSPSVESLLGYTPEEFMEHHVLDLIHPDDLGKIKNHLKEGMQKKRVCYRLRHREGYYIWAETSMKAFYDHDGELRELHTSTRDISLRIRTEQKLEKKSAFIDKALNSLPGLFYVLDEESRYVRVNDSVERELGYSREEVKEMHPLDMYYEKDHKRITKGIEKAFSEGEASAVASLRRKDGSSAVYYLTAAHLKENGVNYILGNGIDISERIDTEDKLRQQGKLFSTLFEVAPVGIAMLDSESAVVKVNSRFETMFGYSQSEVAGIDIDKLITPPGKLVGQREIIEDQSMGSDSFQYESVRIRKDGKKVPVLIGLIPIEIGSGLDMSYVIYVDITERKAHFEELERSLEEKNVLLQEIHHRVKNNLAVVSSFLQLQKLNTEDGHLYKALSASEMRIKSMALIHEQLYKVESFSRIQYRDYIFKLAKSIQNLQDAGKAVDLVIDCDEFELNVNQAIPFALVLNEVICNSFEHAFAEGLRGEIRVSIRERHGMIRAAVEDNGVGLPEGFDMQKCTSLGYTIISTLVDQLEGEIEVTSGKGGEDKVDMKCGTSVYLKFGRSDSKGSSSQLI